MGQGVGQRVGLWKRGGQNSEDRPVCADGMDLSAIRKESRTELTLTFLLFLAVSFFVLYFHSIHSPFYRYSFFQDANVYMAIGRAMEYGLLPYRDVFDHKGVLLYLINYLEVAVFPEKLSGLYMILCLSMSLFLFFAYRIGRLILNVRAALIATFLLLIVTVIANELYPIGAGSSEEFFLPCLTACLFFLLRLSRDADQNARENKNIRGFFVDSVVVGIACGVMLWTKYSMIPVVGLAFLIFYVFLFLTKHYRHALSSILGVIAGAVLISVPCLIYLGAKGLFGDMWSAYIVFNYRYARSDPPMDHVAPNIDQWLVSLPLLIASILGAVYFRKAVRYLSRTGLLCVVIYICFTALNLFLSKRYYIYYFLVVFPLLTLALVAAVHSLSGMIARSRRFLFSEGLKGIVTAWLVITVTLSSAATSVYNWSNGSIFAPETEVEMCANAIRDFQIKFGREDPPRIISFVGNESGLMELLDTYPRERFFYTPGVFGRDAERIILEQKAYIEQGKPDFLYIHLEGDVLSWIEKFNSDYRPILIMEDPREYADSRYYVFVNVEKVREE